MTEKKHKCLLKILIIVFSLIWFLLIVFLIFLRVTLGLHFFYPSCCRYQKDLIHYIKKCPKYETDTVFIVPANFFKRFEWDKMHVMPGLRDISEIEDYIGMDYKKNKVLQEDEKLFLFTKNNKIKREYRTDGPCKCSFYLMLTSFTINYSDTLVIYKTKISGDYYYNIIVKSNLITP